MSTAALRGTGSLNPALVPQPSPVVRPKSETASASAPPAPAAPAASTKLSPASVSQGKAATLCSLEHPEACVDDQGKPPKTFFINGIRTPEASAKANRDLIAKNLGIPVELVYNPTHGLVADAAESLCNITGIDTGISKEMQSHLRKALDSGEKVRVFAHSQGAAITGNALHELAKSYKAAGKTDAQVEAIMSRVEVLSFGGFADEDSFPKGVKFKLNRTEHDAIPQLATACLAIGREYRNVCAEPKKVNSWLNLGGSVLSGLATTGNAIANNAGQAVESAYKNRHHLWEAFGEGKVVDKVLAGDLDAATKKFNSRELDTYCAQIGQDVCSDHLTVILDARGKATSGYLVNYFNQHPGDRNDHVA